MATDFVVGDRVVFRDRIFGTAADTLPEQQPPHLGFVQSVGGDQLDVLWDNAEFSTNLPGDSAALSAIAVLRTQAPASVTLQGQFVRTVGSSPEFSGVVYALLGIEVDVGSDAFVEYALVLTPSGMFLYRLVASLSVTAGG